MNNHLSAFVCQEQYTHLTRAPHDIHRKQDVAILPPSGHSIYDLHYPGHVTNSISDDEDFGDEFSEDELEEIERFKTTCNLQCCTNDLTNQLLQFADRINVDIEKYFGKYKCYILIQGDKSRTSKSGRQLYYADLLRIARGTEDDEDDGTSASTSAADTGKVASALGLGPLSELFEHLTDQSQDNVSRRPSGTPMYARKLPDSFFEEPKRKEFRENSANTSDKNQATSRLLAEDSQTPDFSDLLESWTGEDIQDQKP